MQLCPALPFIVESIIITVSRWGLGDVYYEFFIFSIITEKKQNKKMSLYLFPRIFFSRGGHGRGISSPASSQAGDLEFLCWKILLKISTESCSAPHRLRRGGQHRLCLSSAGLGSGGVPPPLPYIRGEGQG